MDFHVRLARLNERLETLQEGLNGRTAGFPSSFEKLVRGRVENPRKRQRIMALKARLDNGDYSGSFERREIHLEIQHLLLPPKDHYKAKMTSPRPSRQGYANVYKRNQ